MAVLNSGDDALLEEWITAMYEEDIYRVYVMKVASDHRFCYRYEMIPLDGHAIQPENTYVPKWNPVKSLTSWNWGGEEDGGFIIDAAPTSVMTFALMKVKEEYRGNF